MNRLRPGLLILLITCGLGAWTAVATAGASTSRAKLQLRKTSVGTILVNGRGYTVYAFTKDRRNKDNCQKSSTCLRVWPPVKTGGAPIAGPGVKRSLIGTIKLKNGAKQLTYAGHPLYTYIADSHPAETTYVNTFNLGGRWPAVNAAGHEVK
jgi:predicted lipoprotein with Yx(FWY)xxD motif